MKTQNLTQHRNSGRLFFGILLLAWSLAGCTAISPKPEQLQIPYEPPVIRETSFSDALDQLGIQSAIYSNNLLKIQTRDLNDVTGTSHYTGGEIPKSITVMVKSAINAIGGQVVYIPFWPEYFAGIQVSGYPASNQKMLPDVILAGGITEFDRGLTTVDRTRDFDAETEDQNSAPSLFNGKTIGIDYSQGDKWNKAKIAVDFNLISYQAFVGIPKMQASNGITVYKGIKEQEVGFTLFGPTIGLRGSVKKVQGRHDAIRLLVQFSVIQLVGRYLDLPYWKLLEGALPDPVVLEAIKTGYQQEDPKSQTLMLKRLLWLHGHPVPVNDQWDAETQSAIAKVAPSHDGQTASVSVETYLKLYLSVPVDSKSVERAGQYDQLMARRQALDEQSASKEMEKKVEPPKQKKEPAKKQYKRKKRVKPGTPKPKTTEPPQPTPKQDIIIITPLDAQTGNILSRIVRRIGDKQKNKTGFEDKSFESGPTYKSIGARRATGRK